MTIEVWQPGRLYQPGALVRPRTTGEVGTSALSNPSFEDGDTEWDKLNAQWTIDNAAGQAYQGSWFAKFVNSGSASDWRVLRSHDSSAVTAGTSVTAGFMVFVQRAPNVPSLFDGVDYLRMTFRYYNAMDVEIAHKHVSSYDKNDIPVGIWFPISGVGVVPSGAEKMRIDVQARGEDVVLRVDRFTSNLSAVPISIDAIYRATQAIPAFSGTEEPVWPGVGNTVIDNGVTWEGEALSIIFWKAAPIMRSHATTEPTWPTAPGLSVTDNSIVWTTDTGAITDAKAPSGRTALIAASKVFAGDNDIAKFSATTNPRDWSSPFNAGYLGFGLRPYGDQPISAFGEFRTNLVIFSAKGFQMWQVDEDPALMAILDSGPIGTIYHRSIQPTHDRLYLLTKLGVRDFGIAAGSTNLSTGSIGEAIDPLIKVEIAGLSAGQDPIGLYYPAKGQYWIIFGDTAYVMTAQGNKGNWSRYIYPEAITDWTLDGEDLYLRTSTGKVWKVDEDATVDDQVDEGPDGNEDFEGVLQWPHLDLGSMGVDKMMHAFDVIATGDYTAQIGYDPNNFDTLTEAYAVSGNTVPGTAIPMPVTAASFSLKLTFAAAQAWEFNAANLYIDDKRAGNGS